MNDIIDLKIFMDTDRELIKKWKIKRDVEERGHSVEKVTSQILKREKDYDEYINVQKKNADIIIKFYEENHKIYCKIIVNNKKFMNKIIYNNKYNYTINGDNNEIVLCNNYYDNIINLIKNIF